MTRQAYVLDEHKLVVFWARKAACTSIVDALVLDVLGRDAAEFRDGVQRKRTWLRDNGFQRDFQSAAQILRDPAYRSIGMIREPYDRLVSVYLNTFVRHGDVPVQSISDLSEFSRRFHCKVAGRPGNKAGRDYTGLSFFEFVSAVCDRIKRRRWHDLPLRLHAARKDGIRSVVKRPWTAEPPLNAHWNTQVPFWYRATGFRYDYLYRTEQSRAFFAKLAELTGTQVSAKHSNASSYARPGKAADARDLVHAKPVTYATDDAALNKAYFDSPVLRKRVLRAFEPDYHYLNACREDP